MQYTLQPLADIPADMDHSLAYCVIGLVLFIVTWATASEWTSKRKHSTDNSAAAVLQALFYELGLLYFVAAIFIGVVLVLSRISSYPGVTYRNDPVPAVLAELVPEVTNERCGKTSCTNHYIYGKFEVPEGMVLIRIPEGRPMTDKVTLYKN